MDAADESDIAVIVAHLTRVALRHGVELDAAYDIADAVFEMAGNPNDLVKRRVVDAAEPVYRALENCQ